MSRGSTASKINAKRAMQLTVVAVGLIFLGSSTDAQVVPHAFRRKPRIAHITSQSNSASATIGIPSNAVAGDVAVLVDRAGSSTTTAPTQVVPAGWTLINSTFMNPSLSVRTTISYKILTSGDLGTVLTGQNGANSNYKTIVILRPNYVVTNVVVSTVNAQATAAAPTNQVVTNSAVSRPHVVIAAYSSGTGTSFTGAMSPTETYVSGSDTNQNVRILSYYNTPGSDTTATMSDSGNYNILQSFYMSF